MTVNRLVFASALTLCVQLSAAEPKQATAARPEWEGLKDVDIIPCPKRIRLSDQKIVLAQSGKAEAVIVIPDQIDPRLRIGSAEINDRMRALGKVELPVQTLPEYRDRPAAQTAIVVDVRPTAAGKRPQGYEIRVEKPERVAIAGVDPQGALYGCVTLRSLIARDGDRVVLLGVQVADWPDFRNRASDGLSHAGHMFERGRWGVDRALRRGKECIDWALRHKLNFVKAKLPPGVSPPGDGKAHEMTELFVRLCEYANARGIRVMFMAQAKVGTIKAHARDPRFAGIPKFRDYFFCWSRDELIQQSAQGLSQFVRKVGPQAVFLHFPDIWDNNWANRCDKCKRRFGDDRARADANVINTFTRAVRAGHPEALAFFVMQPYKMNLDLPQNAKWRRYYGQLSAMIPEDVYLCQREGSDVEARSWRRVVRQPIFYYHEPQAFIPRRPFITATRFAKTFYFDNDRDLYYSPVPWTTLPMFVVQELATAEYSWNTHAPGSDYILHDPSGVVWSGREGDYCRARERVGETGYGEWLWLRGGSEPPEVSHQFLERACRMAYGPEAAKAMATGYRSGITTERENWGGPASLDLKARAAIADQHYKGARAACEALDPLYAERDRLPTHARAVYLRLLKLNHVFKVIADVQRRLLQAQQYMTAADDASRQKARKEVVAGKRAIENGRAELTKTFTRFSLDKVSDNYRLRVGGLKDALAAIDGFQGAFDLADQQLSAAQRTAPSADVLFACTFDTDLAGATRRNVKIVSPGKIGKAVSCPPDGKLVFPAKGSLSGARGTVEMWVKPNWAWNDNQRHTFFAARAADGGWSKNRMALTKNLNYSLNFSVAGGDGKGCTAAVRPRMFRKGQWIHLAASWDSNRGVKLFVDGALVAVAKGQWEMGTLKHIWLGSDPSAGRGANAVLDEVRVLSTAKGFE